MKKLELSLIGVVIAVVAGVAIVNVNLNSQKNRLSDISLQNVEAFGCGEDDGEVDCCPDNAFFICV
ncbi:MAG: NVEALA domain-containing protein [Bacteroidales bacterium]|jgi:hypothetical protein|nr:NVEALA domain-containing protein [Bacteroidales bacterium]